MYSYNTGSYFSAFIIQLSFKMKVVICEAVSTTYMPCFFWSSTSSLYRVLTPSIMTWTSWTSE